eukprot:gene26815-biopygen17404
MEQSHKEDKRTAREQRDEERSSLVAKHDEEKQRSEQEREKLK